MMENKKKIFFVRLNQNYKKNIITMIKDWRLYVLVIPMIIWYILWVYKPMGGLLIAFKNYKVISGVSKSDFAGFYYFKYLLFSAQYAQTFWQAFRNTFMINIYGLLFGFPIPIILAIFFNEITHEFYRKVTQTIVYLPHFISEVTMTSLIIILVYAGNGKVGIIATVLYHFSDFLYGIKIFGHHIIGHQLIPVGMNIIHNPAYFRPLYIFSGIWKEAGYSSIVYYAAIMGISPVLYEAVKVDGASKLQQIKYVIIPGMSGTLIIMIILRIGRMISVGYERIILLYNVDTYKTADVISSFVYRVGITQGNTTMGATADIFNAVIGFSLVIGANFISRRITRTSLW